MIIPILLIRSFLNACILVTIYAENVQNIKWYKIDA